MTSADDSAERRLEQVLRASRVLQDAPEPLIERAIALWQPRRQTQPVAGGALRRLVATLGFDSAALAPTALGMRGAGTQAARQMLFSANGCDVDLRIARGADGRRWQLSGQVLGAVSDGVASLAPVADEAMPGPAAQPNPVPMADALEVGWNDLSEFRFDAVPAGRWVLTLRSGDWLLELPPLDLGG